MPDIEKRHRGVIDDLADKARAEDIGQNPGS
jgi:hypothetical protein